MMSEAQKRGNKKYLSKFDDIKIRVPEGERDKYKQYAESQGKSLNQLVIDLIRADMAAHGQPIE